MNEIHWNTTKQQWELNGRKTTYAAARKYWDQERGRKARWSAAAYQEMQRIALS